MQSQSDVIVEQKGHGTSEKGMALGNLGMD